MLIVAAIYLLLLLIVVVRAVMLPAYYVYIAVAVVNLIYTWPVIVVAAS